MGKRRAMNIERNVRKKALPVFGLYTDIVQEEYSSFEEGPANLDDGDTPIRTVRPSELFTAPNVVLVGY